jgi:hypothetical protein
MRARLILLAILVAQLGDAVTFAFGVTLHGIGIEANPFAVALFDNSGIEGVLVLKGATIVAILAALALTADRYPRLVTRAGGTAIAIGLLGLVTNVTSLLLLAGA